MKSDATLLADIGATNIRFAVTSNQSCLEKVQEYSCADYQIPIQAINYYLKINNIETINNICFAIAGPVIGDVVETTNSQWVFNKNELKDNYQLNNVTFLNDFEAIAYSIPQLSADQLQYISTQRPENSDGDNFTYIILGPGSGLGVAALLKRAGQLLPVVTEAGHVNFSPMNELQHAIIKIIQRDHEYISNEMLLSGPGLVNLYNAICEIEGKKSTFKTPATICQAANNSSDELCMQTLKEFHNVLAQVAGDMTLSFSAFDGVYIAGGIVPRNSGLINHLEFRENFKHKNQHQDLLDATPISIVMAPNPGLIGAHYYCLHHM